MNSKALAVSLIAEDVRSGLLSTPRVLPPKLFYDARGSALFEQITTLPEYYLTNAEREIFEKHASDIVEQAGRDLTIVELGAGSANKTVVLLRALAQNQQAVSFYPVDVSSAALGEAVERVSALPESIEVHPVVSDYTSGLPFLRNIRGRKLILYIGSSIGNFEPTEASLILRTLRLSMRNGDAILLGTDMRKSLDVLLPAYDDSQGITAAFNKNVLDRINRELGGDFDLEQFAHRIVWNDEESRIEMHLESMVNQSVIIRDLGLQVEFAAGETIHTENSYKFTMELLNGIASSAGLALEQTWSDSRNLFTVHLLRNVCVRAEGLK